MITTMKIFFLDNAQNVNKNVFNTSSAYLFVKSIRTFIDLRNHHLAFLNELKNKNVNVFIKLNVPLKISDFNLSFPTNDFETSVNPQFSEDFIFDNFLKLNKFEFIRLSYFQIQKKQKQNAIALSCMTSLFDCSPFLPNLYFESDIVTKQLMHNVEFIQAIFPQTLESFSHNSHIQSYDSSNCQFFEFFTNMSLYTTWNILIVLSSGSFLSSFNPDDKRPLNWSTHCVKYLLENPMCLLITPSYVSSQHSRPWFQERTNYNLSADSSIVIKNTFSFQNFQLKHHKFDIHNLFTIINNEIHANDIPNSCPIWRKSIHSSVGFFDDRNDLPSDFLLWLRTFTHYSSQYYMIQSLEIICYFHIHQEQLHKKQSFSNKEWSQIIKQYCSPNMQKYLTQLVSNEQ
jgi:hypothetical protein